jgi:hypothetical protein
MSPARVAIFDTNVLLLWLVLRVDIGLLRNFKRVRSFTVEDAQLLWSLATSFAAIVATPHVLSQTSDFVEQAPDYRRPALIEALRSFIAEHNEWYEEARLLCGLDQFQSVGLADAGLLSISGRATVVTADRKLAGQIEGRGGHVINFNHYRSGQFLDR